MYVCMYIERECARKSERERVYTTCIPSHSLSHLENVSRFLFSFYVKRTVFDKTELLVSKSLPLTKHERKNGVCLSVISSRNFCLHQQPTLNLGRSVCLILKSKSTATLRKLNHYCLQLFGHQMRH